MKNFLLTTNILYWLPRILGIVFILFLSLFALDAFTGQSSLLNQILGFLIHLTPNFLMLILLILAWKRELLGGVAYILLSVVFTIFFNTYNEISSFLLISFPLLIIGLLFLLHSYLVKRQEKIKHAV